MPPARSPRPSIADSLREYGRGFAGGLLFSLPLLYTMEVWWAGFIAHPARLLGGLVATVLLLLAYNRVSGMHADASWLEVVIDSVEELGLGLLTAALVLLLIGQIGPATPLREALGKVVVEAVVVAIGFSVGTAQLASGAQGSVAGGGARRVSGALPGRLTVAMCGALLFAANVAPTEEIVVIAVAAGPYRLLGLAALSMLVAGATIVLTRGPVRARAGDRQPPLLVETGTAYAVGLVVSAAILWFFGRFDALAWELAVRETVVLGLPSSLGAAAGGVLLATR
jgi:putative integral membrane protein (TIGR02587 family)